MQCLYTYTEIAQAIKMFFSSQQQTTNCDKRQVYRLTLIYSKAERYIIYRTKNSNQETEVLTQRSITCRRRNGEVETTSRTRLHVKRKKPFRTMEVVETNHELVDGCLHERSHSEGEVKRFSLCYWRRWLRHSLHIAICQRRGRQNRAANTEV